MLLFITSAFLALLSNALPLNKPNVQLHSHHRLFEDVAVGEMLPLEPDVSNKSTPSFGSELAIQLAPPSYQRITILHTNDVHAHFDPFNDMGLDCRNQDINANRCYGGIARISHLIQKYRQSHQNVLLLDAGDQFTGTLFFQTFQADIIAKWMNDIKYDVMAVGNHEFDKGEEYLGHFIRNLSFPLISSNIDIQTAPHLFEAGIKPFVVFPQYRLAVLGYITKTAADITPAKTIIFYDPIAIVQAYVNHLESIGIRRIICLSHNGYEQDKRLAQETHGIQLIVGGHSHSLLLNDTKVKGVKGPYPSPVMNKQGKMTYVVQAHRFGDYLGHLDLDYNERDELISLFGEPILLDQQIPQDPVFQAQVDHYRSAFMGTEKVICQIDRDYVADECSGNRECPLANLVTNSYIEYGRSLCKDCYHVAIITTGGLRASLSRGPVSLADLIHVLPFSDYLCSFNMTGAAVLELLESVVAGYSKSRKHLIHTPQFGGLKYTYNPIAPIFQRIQFAQIEEYDPHESDYRYRPLDPDKHYTILTSDFVAAGGDAILQSPTGFEFISINGTKIPELQVVVDYLNHRNQSIISIPLDHRISTI